MRKLDDLLSAKINNEVSELIEYQKIFEEKKKKDEFLLPQGVWIDEEEPMRWEKIEAHAWNIIIEHGYDLKLFALWAQAYLSIFGICELEFIFNATYKVCDNKEIFGNDDEVKFSLIKYLDKAIATPSLSDSLNKYNKDLSLNYFNALIKKDSKKDVEIFFNSFDIDTMNDLIHIKDNIYYSFENVKKVFNFCILEKIQIILDSFDLFVTYYKEYQEQKLERVQEEVVEEVVIAEFSSKEDAMNEVFRVLKYLHETDSSNIAIPLLKKALKWQNLGVMEIMKDLENGSEFEAFLKIFK